jgi:hypothetical protein
MLHSGQGTRADPRHDREEIRRLLLVRLCLVWLRGTGFPAGHAAEPQIPPHDVYTFSVTKELILLSS